MKTTIYRPKGRALEFSALAMNHYTGCGHQCIYCSAPLTLHADRREWYANPRPRLTIDEMVAGIRKWDGPKEPVLLCFTTDPYQPIDDGLKLTRTAIELLNGHGFPVHILTKAGKLAQRDFDLLAAHPGNAFATTLTFTDHDDAREWEPYAALPEDRMDNVMEARHRKITTWVSLEPVIEPLQTTKLIRTIAPYTDHFKVGTLNYHARGREIDWRQFGIRVMKQLYDVGARYYVKKDLAGYLGKSEGFWGGPEADR
ncbi:hypothetical protein LCGC14_2367300 [marine sediment metagenome]|uniref:Radical SAM core domain-containing protein n=1 Tax=marine sediment metagenome TaxID=412755 RepID=A0A0F9C4T3_9ZZZZ